MNSRYRKKQIFLSPLFTEKEVRTITKMIDENIKRSSSPLAEARKLDWGTLSAIATFTLKRGDRRVLITELRNQFRVELLTIKKTS